MKYWLFGFIILGGLFWLLFLRDIEPSPSLATEGAAVAQDVETSKEPPRLPDMEKSQSEPAPLARGDQSVAAIRSSPFSASAVGPREEREQEVKLIQGLLREPDGSLLRADYSNIESKCAGMGMRLPTIRELANLAKSRGAKGILNSFQIKDQERMAEKVEHIMAINPDGKADDFFYAPEGFKHDSNHQNIPEDSGEGGFWLQGHWLWSSSRSPKCPLEEPAKFCAYAFDAKSGKISDKYDTVQLSASCVKEVQ
jgi:hypothetical protein